LYFQESIEVLGYWAVETLGDLQSPSRGLDPAVKIHTIPILMHQMCISTTYVSSVMLRPKNFILFKAQINLITLSMFFVAKNEGVQGGSNPPL
jgi:hypothetical protein